MKRLTCEMCGSTDLIKQDGVLSARLVAANTPLRKPKR